VLIASISDICQYAIGYNYGTHYVSTISPKKTYEGYIAGVGSAILYSHFIQYTPIDMHLTLFEYTICFIYGALGDLISSYFKRQLSIKDWSYLLGKQGGVLDRGNSIVGIILYFITSYNKY
jgi:phosphatidate cytidylyltransferase